jgi:hypothetical protein
METTPFVSDTCVQFLFLLLLGRFLLLLLRRILVLFPFLFGSSDVWSADGLHPLDPTQDKLAWLHNS